MGLVLLAAAGICALVLVRRALESERPSGTRGDWLLFSSVWFMSWAVAVAFVIGGHEPGVDRHAYPFLAALAVLAATSTRHLRPIVRSIALGVLGLWLVWAATVAQGRIAVWSDDLTLWRHEMSTAPRSARVRHNLAAELAARRRYGNARRHLRAALVIDAGYWPSLIGLAGIDCIRGRTLCAAAHLAEAAALGAPFDQIASVRATCARRAFAE